jgi:hypothetical protein
MAADSLPRRLWRKGEPETILPLGPLGGGRSDRQRLGGRFPWNHIAHFRHGTGHAIAPAVLYCVDHAGRCAAPGSQDPVNRVCATMAGPRLPADIGRL